MSTSKAERVFADALARESQGRVPDLDALRSCHPELASELTHLHRNWQCIQEILGSTHHMRTQGTARAMHELLARETDQGLRIGATSDDLLSRIELRRGVPNRYRIVREIGSGGMGVVYELWDDELQRSLAMKVLRGPCFQEDWNASHVARFLEEAQITAQLDHPGVVPVHEVGIDEAGHLFFTMQLVHGIDLASALGSNGERLEEWSLARILDVLIRVCDAVSYAHSRGVIHRDLKLSNIMVGRFGEVYVMDWGLARITSGPAEPGVDASSSTAVRTARYADLQDPATPTPRTLEGQVVGTPNYMSPEQAHGEHDQLDERSDVYSLGAVLYHMLAGRPPYSECGTSALSIITAVRNGPPTSIAAIAPACPAELAAVCAKSMGRNRQERYPDVESLGADLRAFVEGRVVVAHGSGILVAARKWIARNRGVSAAIGVALLLLGVVYAQAWYGERQKQRALPALSLNHAGRLIEEADALWPPHPERAAAMETWIAEARSLLAEVDSLVSTLTPDSLASEEAQALEELEMQLVVLRNPQRGLLDGTSNEHGVGIVRRLRMAAELNERSLTGRLARARWAEAIDSIADHARCPGYEGLVIVPQRGLLPIGQDPLSGLWEFAHVQTGEVPGRDQTGQLVLEERSALVFVLVPPGRATIGAQTDPSLPNYDALLRHYDETRGTSMARAEGPVHEVELAAFFLSKYEMTQGQWLRLTGENPSRNRRGTEVDERPIDLTHPVETVSWNESMRVLGWYGLTLPSEAQWECAAWARSPDPSWIQDLSDPSQLELFAHFNIGGPYASLPSGAAADGWETHAPAHSFPANAYGLHHILGNVNEWCRDGFEPSHQNAQYDRRGERINAAFESSAIRGGGFQTGPERCRASFRVPFRRDGSDSLIGLRPARFLDE